MKRLCDLVEIEANNEECVVFKVKDGVEEELKALDYFKGDEARIFMSKGRNLEFTVFDSNGKNYSYSSHKESLNVPNLNLEKQGRLIRECAIIDFGIVCDTAHARGTFFENRRLLKSTLDVRNLDDALRIVTLVPKDVAICDVYVNEQLMSRGKHIKDIDAWFEKRGYKLDTLHDFLENGFLLLDASNVVMGECVPLNKSLNDILKEATIRSYKENNEHGFDEKEIDELFY